MFVMFKKKKCLKNDHFRRKPKLEGREVFTLISTRILSCMPAFTGRIVPSHVVLMKYHVEFDCIRISHLA